MRYILSSLRARSFWMVTLGLSLGVPVICLLLFKLGAPRDALVLSWFYTLPPLFAAELIGIRNNDLTVYKSPLFRGYIWFEPTFPVGWAFCIGIWFGIGALLWLILAFLWRNPDAAQSRENLDWDKL
jgi:hypothetical protein